ncbi:hypothetical protein WOLCODRAFT_80615 [Wolfiporia cocos MD-104 SS10]|uniref:UbiA prenyltransferase n=1 Tax=Wolfiporia cocos (strain MD-104) TaxID=742152 RepID=A0A2H3JFJ1_WOLCO|nr:hypothetical protein WOLCODRAFT_80615 [Wolfiporia cocos MD-104 SS10]
MKDPLSILHHMYTIYLFTKSDNLTIMVPVTLFALAASPMISLQHIYHAVLWLWLHLLQTDVANQTTSPGEDERNKGWRPIPSGRMSLKSALVLRWLLVPICWAMSWLYSEQMLATSAAVTVLVILYNELSISGHWFGKNVLNTLGIAAYEVGTTLLASGRNTTLDSVGTRSVLISAGIILTTIHAQDFRDVQGDLDAGRRTFPIISPTAARLTVLVGLLCWTAATIHIWQLDWVTAMLITVLALFIGWRFLVRTTVGDDEVSFIWYNIWMSCIHVLPAYYRYTQRRGLV